MNFISFVSNWWKSQIILSRGVRWKFIDCAKIKRKNKIKSKQKSTKKKYTLSIRRFECRRSVSKVWKQRIKCAKEANEKQKKKIFNTHQLNAKLAKHIYRVPCSCSFNAATSEVFFRCCFVFVIVDPFNSLELFLIFSSFVPFAHIHLFSFSFPCCFSLLVSFISSV